MPGRDFLPRGADLRELVRLSLPVVGVQVGLMLMGVVDVVMVGHLSSEALAAVAVGNIYVWSTAIFGIGLLLAVDPLVAQGVGAADNRAVALAVQRGLVLAVLVTIPATLLILPGEAVLRALAQPAEVIPVAADYARATLPGLVAFFAFGVLRSTLQALGRLGPLLATIVGANLVNGLLNWMLIHGRLGAPALGAVGAGWATAASRLVLGLGLLGLAWPVLRPALRPWHRAAVDPVPLRNMLRVGLPIAVTLELEYMAFGAVGLLVGVEGALALAGHQIALNLASLTFMVPLGISGAAAVLVGRAVGRGDPDAMRRAAGAALGSGMGFMAASALVFLAVPAPLARLYATDAAVVALAASLLPIAGLFQVFDGAQAVAIGILRGAGDTAVPMVINVLGFWLLGVPVSYALGRHTGLGVVGYWWGFVAGLAGVALLLGWRVRARLRRAVHRLDVERRPVTP